jgi:hypothetical protein
MPGGREANARGMCDTRFTCACIFATVEPGPDNALVLVLPYGKADALQILLDSLAATAGREGHIVVVLDQAGCDGAKALVIPDGISRLSLPPGSPELDADARVARPERAMSLASSGRRIQRHHRCRIPRPEQAHRPSQASVLPRLVPPVSPGLAIGGMETAD